MIINIRGTSGSGKSTLVRRVMELPVFGTRSAHYAERRKYPLWYELHRSDGGVPLAVVGHYENPCGGGDTIAAGLDYVDALVRECHDGGARDVLYEGLILGSDMSRIVRLHEEGNRVLVVFLTTPLPVCLARVNARRAERAARTGREYSPVNPRATEDKHRGLLRAAPRLRAAGVPVAELDCDAALERVREELGA